MKYLLSVGLSFTIASGVLESLKRKEPEYYNPQIKRRFMLSWDVEKKTLKLEDFKREVAIASLDDGQPVIPLWLDRIHQRLSQKL